MQDITGAAIFADPTLAVSRSEERVRSFTLDTTLVLFFLAMEMGRVPLTWNVESVLSGITFLAFLVLPYFLPLKGEGTAFTRWLVGRILVATTGIMFGLVLGQAIGSLLPETFRFVPMSLLIVAAIICCNIQIYGIIRDRLAR